MASVPVGNSPAEVLTSGNYAYVRNNANPASISVVDISNPATANVVNTVSLGAQSFSMTISGNYLYADTDSNSVKVIDISNPVTASIVNSITTGMITGAVQVYNGYLYMTENVGGVAQLKIADISNPVTATVGTTISVDSNQRGAAFSGDYAYLADAGANGVISIVDISTPTSASVVATVSVGAGPSQSPTISGNYAYVSNNNGQSVSVLDISEVANVLPPNDVVALSVDGTIQSTILSGGGTIALYSDNNGNIVPSFSDQSLKQDVVDVSNALSKVRMLQGKYYSWKDTDRFGAQREMGFIAQEVEPYVPEVVRSVGSFKTLNYANLTALHNEAIKELDLRLGTMESIAGIDEESATLSLFGRFAEYLAGEVQKVIGGIVHFTGKVFMSEIILKDTVTGESYCVHIEDGELIATVGESCTNEMVEETEDADSIPVISDPVEDESTIEPSEEPQESEDVPIPEDLETVEVSETSDPELIVEPVPEPDIIILPDSNN